MPPLLIEHRKTIQKKTHIFAADGFAVMKFNAIIRQGAIFDGFMAIVEVSRDTALIVSRNAPHEAHHRWRKALKYWLIISFFMGRLTTRSIGRSTY
jgi:hypothetical protein